MQMEEMDKANQETLTEEEALDQEMEEEEPLTEEEIAAKATEAYW